MFEKLHPAESERPMQVLHNRPGNLFAKYFADFLRQQSGAGKNMVETARFTQLQGLAIACDPK